jgi:basic membrane protein A and related proteins
MFMNPKSDSDCTPTAALVSLSHSLGVSFQQFRRSAWTTKALLSLEVSHRMKLTRSAFAALIAVSGALVVAPVSNSQDQKSVALMFDLTGRGDKSFNDAAAAGLDKAKAEFTALKATESVPSGADGDRAERLKTVLADKNGLVICVGFLWTPDCSKGAKANPTVAFASIDDELSDQDEGATKGKPLANAAGYKFAEQEGSYLVGYIAGQTTKTGKVGFIGGVEIDLIKKFEAGFEAGAKAGAKAAKKKITITQKYASQPPDFSGFTDVPKGKAIAAAMYKSGIDVIYVAAGSTGNGAFIAAKESGKKPGKIWAIGVDSDQYQTISVANGRDYILTSMLKKVDVAAYEAIKAYVNGKPATGTSVLGLKEGGVDFSTTNKALTASLTAKVNKVKADIISGAVVPPLTPTRK